MSVHQEILCEKCNCPDFDYDSSWKEYSCTYCGWIVADKEEISNIDKNNKAKASSPQNATENAKKTTTYSPKPVTPKRKKVKGVFLMAAGGLWIAWLLLGLPTAGVIMRFTHGQDGEAIGALIFVLICTWLGAKVVKGGYKDFNGLR